MSDTYYCLKCGHNHRRDSMIGGFHHFALDIEREGFDPEDAAVGIAFVNATEDRRRPSATAAEVEEEFQALGFDEQFPGLDVEETLRDWVDVGLIGDERHTGHHWFLFLCNRFVPRDADRSPESLHNWMKNYASEYERATLR